jgi:hypothetical protein
MAYAGPEGSGVRGPKGDSGARGGDLPEARRDALTAAALRAANRPSSRARGRAPSGRSGATFVAGIVVGAILGASAALVLAPLSGAETRGRLARHGRRLRRGAGDVWDDLAHELRQARRAVRRARARSELPAAD